MRSTVRWLPLQTARRSREEIDPQTAMMIAHKFLDEPVCSNKQWSLVGDLTVKEMNSLELHMLWTLQFDCNVSRAEFDACQAALGALDASLPEHRASALALQPRGPCTSSIANSA